MNDNEWLRRKAEAAEHEGQRLLAAAKERARLEGKEPFDFEALCRMYDPTSDLATRLFDPERRARELECRYYIDCPQLRTLAEFAARMTELDSWR